MQKFVLLLSIDKRIRENMVSKQFPNHMINLCKQDLLNIQEIQSSINPCEVKLNNSFNCLSKLESLCKANYYFLICSINIFF